MELAASSGAVVEDRGDDGCDLSKADWVARAGADVIGADKWSRVVHRVRVGDWGAPSPSSSVTRA